MKKITLILFLFLIINVCLSQNFDCKYYLYLEAYEKYNKNKNFENLKDLIIKGLIVSKMKLEIMNRSTDYIDTTINEVKKIYDIKTLREKYNIVKFKIKKINKEYILYLINKNKNVTECMKIVGNLNKSNFETLKKYYIMCLYSKNIQNKELNNKNDSLYKKIYKSLVKNNITDLKNIFNNLTVKELKNDLEKYIKIQGTCGDPICNISLYNKIKKELFVLMCRNLNGKFSEYYENGKIYYGCELDKKPYSDWINVSNKIYRPMDCELEESDKYLIKR